MAIVHSLNYDATTGILDLHLSEESETIIGSESEWLSLIRRSSDKALVGLRIYNFLELVLEGRQSPAAVNSSADRAKTMNEFLEEYAAEKSQEFRPGCWYSEEADTLFCYFEAGDELGEYINPHFCLLRDDSSQRIIGVQVSCFKSFIRDPIELILSFL
ncbi:MAG: hypothetical protein Q8P45_03320 [Candidatus Harrisonbacteria bacterium]|nr:hypothetical protein [Candidatus Harrisonbacteria bacterium]